MWFSSRFVLRVLYSGFCSQDPDFRVWSSKFILYRLQGSILGVIYSWFRSELCLHCSVVRVLTSEYVLRTLYADSCHCGSFSWFCPQGSVVTVLFYCFNRILFKDLKSKRHTTAQIRGSNRHSDPGCGLLGASNQKVLCSLKKATEY